MKRKRELTKFEKFQEAVKDFFGNFRFGIDFWALGLFGILMLPTIVWWCYSPAHDVLRTFSTTAMDVFAYIFQAITIALLVFVVRKDGNTRSIDYKSIFFLFGILSLVLYYAAWVYYFCAWVNIAVMLFMAVFPCTALGCFAALRKNWLAFLPLILFFALHLSSTFINYV